MDRGDGGIRRYATPIKDNRLQLAKGLLLYTVDVLSRLGDICNKEIIKMVIGH